jgi:hypothetical protein
MPVCIPEHPPDLSLRVTGHPEIEDGRLSARQPPYRTLNVDLILDALFVGWKQVV